MSRFPKPFFRARRWAVQIHGKQVNLGPNRDAASCRFHEIMGGPPGKPATL
jgi:hypothetical protein